MRITASQIQALVVGLFVGQAACGAIVDHGNYLTDEASGLDWLDVTASVNMSFNQVNAEFGVAGLFSGWRYANASQFNALISHSTGVTPSANLADQTPIPSPSASTLIDQLGSTLDTYYLHYHGMTYAAYLSSFGTINVFEKYASGLLSDEVTGTAGDDVYSALVFRYINQNNGDIYILSSPHDTVKSLDAHDYDVGSYLVRETVPVANIPEPGSLLLCSLGLFGMGLTRQKTKYSQ